MTVPEGTLTPGRGWDAALARSRRTTWAPALAIWARNNKSEVLRSMVKQGILIEIYTRLLITFGQQGWWPAESSFEMCVGAILTQSTAWMNVEKAISNLKAAGKLEPKAINDTSEEVLAQLVKPSGYFNVKARKLKAFCEHLFKYHGGYLESLFHVKLPNLRDELLSIWGIGPETADSIILYGAGQPIFVVDAYTRRIFGRLVLTPPDADYHLLQRYFMENLSPDVPLFQEYHALIVALGKNICRPTPFCSRCPLSDLCSAGPGRPSLDANG